MKKFDVIVVGGGMIGAATALGLAKQAKRVLMLEQVAPQSFEKKQAIDLRVSAISAGSARFLSSLNAWDDIVSMRLCPYRRLETWEDSRYKLSFNAQSAHLNELGFIIENRLIQLALWQQCQIQANLTVSCKSKIVHIAKKDQGHILTLNNKDRFYCRYLIGADGAHSLVRDYAKIAVCSWDYRQRCLLVNVQTELEQQDITWQWFTPQGPRAFLPLPNNQASLVWYDHPERIKQLCALPIERLKDEILNHFPAQLGDIDVLQRGAFALTRRHAKQYVKNNIALLGDAAHTIHPLAGQGVNLGFKDVQALLAQTAQCTNDELATAFKHYEQKRKRDNLMLQLGMDILYCGFSYDHAPLKILRNIGLQCAQYAGPIKQKALKYALGI